VLVLQCFTKIVLHWLFTVTYCGFDTLSDLPAPECHVRYRYGNSQNSSMGN